MTHPRSNITAAVAALLLLTAACSRPIPHHDYYLLRTGAPPAAAGEQPPVDGRLAVAELDTAPGYADSRIVYRLSAQRFRLYNYHEWATTPGRLVAGELRRYLSESGAFADVVRGAQASPDLLLEGTVLAIEEVDTEAAAGLQRAARVSLSLVLRRAVDGRLVWRGVIDETRAAGGDTPDAVAAAAGVALGDALAKRLPEIVEAARKGLLLDTRPAANYDMRVIEVEPAAEDEEEEASEGQGEPAK